MAKISKQAALYVFRPETQYTCAECLYNKEPGKCAQYGPTEKIKPYGSCNIFLHSTNENLRAAIPWLGLVTKIETGYTENRPGFSCKRCEYFGKEGPALTTDEEVRDCRKVDKDSEGDTPGEINPNACCDLWEADAKRGQMTTEEFQKPKPKRGAVSFRVRKKAS